MDTLLASKDRKVTNAVNKSGKQATIANTFGLPAGMDYSCGGATSVCESVCYAGKLEVLFPSVKKNLLHNWELLKDADRGEAEDLLGNLLEKFERDCERRGAEKIFRIHWDGDFFNETYLQAWIEIIRRHSTVIFWVYTRQAFAAVGLHKAFLPNLAIYFSADEQNLPVAKMLRETYGIRIAMLGKTFQEGQARMREITGKPGGKCPENLGVLPLISTEGSACARCRLCVDGKADIVFSSSKK